MNDGDVSVGMVVILEFNGEVTNPKVLNVTTGEYFRLENTYKVGEIIRIVTLRGEKEVLLTTRDGTEKITLNFGMKIVFSYNLIKAITFSNYRLIPVQKI